MKRFDFTIIVSLVGIVLAIVAVLLYGLRRRAHNPNREKKYDERQNLARLQAYRAAFWTMAVTLALSLITKEVLWEVGLSEQTTLAWTWRTASFALWLGALVFCVLAIWNHAFQRIGWGCYGCAIMAAMHAVTLWQVLAVAVVNYDRVFYSVFGLVFWLLLLVVLLLRNRRDRLEERAESEH